MKGNTDFIELPPESHYQKKKITTISLGDWFELQSYILYLGKQMVEGREKNNKDLGKHGTYTRTETRKGVHRN